MVRQDEKQIFFTVSLPRSGTAWLANYFTYGPSYCYHEPLADCSSLEDLYRKIDNTPRRVVGVADTLVPLFIPKIAKRYPNAKYIIIDRPEEDVKLSLYKAGYNTSGFEHHLVAFKSAKDYLQANAPYDNFKSAWFDHMFVPTIGGSWEWIVGTKSNKFRDQQLCDTNVQVIPTSLLRRYNRDRQASLLKEMELYSSAKEE